MSDDLTACPGLREARRDDLATMTADLLGAPKSHCGGCKEAQTILADREAQLAAANRQLKTLVDGDTLHGLLAQTQARLTAAEAKLRAVGELRDIPVVLRRIVDSINRAVEGDSEPGSKWREIQGSLIGPTGILRHIAKRLDEVLSRATPAPTR